MEMLRHWRNALTSSLLKEWLHGENMYKCDGCNDYVKAWKCLTIRWAPNILTIALKRFQSGRFEKLNKRVSFPETLDLTPYMSEDGDDSNVYKLYAVRYTKDFSGNWYRIDDCEVARVEFEEVLSQVAYMLLYSRVSPRQSCLRTSGMNAEAEHCSKEQIECVPVKEYNNSPSRCVSRLSLNGSVHSEISRHEVGSSTGINTTSSLSKEESFNQNLSLSQIDSEAIRINGDDRDRVNPIAVRESVDITGSTCSQPCSSDMEVSSCDRDPSSEAVRGAECMKMVEVRQQCSSVSNETKNCEQDS